jgi:hypothetical protein
MIAHSVSLNHPEDLARVARSSIGGYPILADGQGWPRCKLCDSQQVLFFQMDLSSEFGLPFASGSHLLVFMCPRHNEIPALGDELAVGGKLPEGYWHQNEGHYGLIMNPPGVPEVVHEVEPHLIYSEVLFQANEETTSGPDAPHVYGSEGFKVGGVPSWAQNPESYWCSCGSEMAFICQVPLDFGFRKAEQADSQPESFSTEEYCLFLGNEVYIFGCTSQCEPLSVWAVVQN